MELEVRLRSGELEFEDVVAHRGIGEVRFGNCCLVSYNNIILRYSDIGLGLEVR